MNDMPNSCKPGHAPEDSELNTVTTLQDTVTIHAAAERESLNSS